MREQASLLQWGRTIWGLGNGDKWEGPEGVSQWPVCLEQSELEGEWCEIWEAGGQNISSIRTLTLTWREIGSRWSLEQRSVVIWAVYQDHCCHIEHRLWALGRGEARQDNQATGHGGLELEGQWILGVLNLD